MEGCNTLVENACLKGFSPLQISTKNRAGVAELDAYLEDTQNGGHQTDRKTH